MLEVYAKLHRFSPLSHEFGGLKPDVDCLALGVHRFFDRLQNKSVVFVIFRAPKDILAQIVLLDGVLIFSKKYLAIVIQSYFFLFPPP